MSTPLPKFSAFQHTYPRLWIATSAQTRPPSPSPLKLPEPPKLLAQQESFSRSAIRAAKGQLELATYWQGSIQRVEAFHRGEVSLGQNEGTVPYR